MKYGYQRTVSLSFDDVDNRIRASLKAIGFGVITEINVKDTMKEKLNKSFKKFKILGACNPPVAFEALSIENEIGLLLPCNVTIWENEDGSTTVSAIDAKKMLSITGLDTVEHLAAQVNDLLKKSVDAV